MLPTLALSAILKKWRDVISTDSAILAYCTEKYNVAPKLFVEIDERNPPKEDSCPYIVLWPGHKVEGLNNVAYQYVIPVSWVIYQRAKVTTGAITEYSGVYEIDELGQLILKAVAEANPDYPVTNVDFASNLTDYQPQYVGHMEITISVAITMGADLEY
ncbi:MAG: hypothetical protein ABFC57_17375 [Veillonellales bacterium]